MLFQMLQKLDPDSCRDDYYPTSDGRCDVNALRDDILIERRKHSSAATAVSRSNLSSERLLRLPFGLYCALLCPMHLCGAALFVWLRRIAPKDAPCVQHASHKASCSSTDAASS